jgi:hypothetical protein
MAGLYLFPTLIAVAVGTFTLLDTLARRQDRRERERR